MAYDGGSSCPLHRLGARPHPARHQNQLHHQRNRSSPHLLSPRRSAATPGVELDGRDISEVLTQGAPTPHDQIVLFNNEDPVGIRTQHWKYVEETYNRGSIVNFANRQVQTALRRNQRHPKATVSPTATPRSCSTCRPASTSPGNLRPVQKRRAPLLQETERTKPSGLTLAKRSWPLQRENHIPQTD